MGAPALLHGAGGNLARLAGGGGAGGSRPPAHRPPPGPALHPAPGGVRHALLPGGPALLRASGVAHGAPRVSTPLVECALPPLRRMLRSPLVLLLLATSAQAPESEEASAAWAAWSDFPGQPLLTPMDPL